MWQVIGQDRAVTALQRSLGKGTLAHAYLLLGPPHVGKMTLALDLARVVNCEAAETPCGECASCQRIAEGKHADVQIIGLNGNQAEAKSRTEIGIDQIREVQHSSNLPPFLGRFRVFIIDGAEQLSIEAANCLLKTLEEPVGGVVFVLIATSDRLLPATVVSRCQCLELSRLAAAEVEAALINSWGVGPERAGILARLSRGCLGWAVSAVTNDDVLRQRTERMDRLLDVGASDLEERFAYAAKLASEFSQNRGPVWELLDLWITWWRDLLLVKVDCSEAVVNVDRLSALAERGREYSLVQIRGFIRSIQAAGEQLRQNANPRLVLEAMMLDIPRR